MKSNDLRIIKTLRQIDIALLECISEHPFQKVTVDMICETALINRSTFYKHYRDKYDLLDKFLDATLEKFSQNLCTDFVLATPTNIGDRFYGELFHDAVTFLYKERDKYLVLWKADIERKVYDEMINLICEKIICKLNMSSPAQGTGLYRELYARFFASNLMTLVRWGFCHHQEITIEDIEQLMQSNMKNGMFFTFKQYI